MTKIINGHIIEPKADLRGANLMDANLICANLICADLQGANLEGANLNRANLEGADLTHTKGVIGFSLGRHFGFSFKHKDIPHVKIGCECYTLEHWLKNIDEIGKKNRYNESQIKPYKLMLGLLKEME